MLALYLLMKEMAPSWAYKHIKLWCDNKTVVSAVAHKRGPLHRRDLHHIVNCICELSAEYHFRFWIDHIDGDFNVMADRLSRFKDLYVDHQLDPAEFTYVERDVTRKTANGVFEQLLKFKRVPLNDDDPRRNM